VSVWLQWLILLKSCRPLAVLIQSEIRSTTVPADPKTAVGETLSPRSERLSMIPLARSNIFTPARRRRARKKTSVNVSGVTLTTSGMRDTLRAETDVICMMSVHSRPGGRIAMMTKRRLAMALGVAACLTFQAGAAHAQASSCVKILLDYVGKPLAKAVAERGAGLAAEYFVAKLKHSEHAGRSDTSANQLTQRDLQELREIYMQNGESECQLRQDVQRAVPSAYNSDYMIPPMRLGSTCLTLAGSCPIQVPTGSSCFCYSAWGQVFPGIAQ
jgi:hypothetical protein